MNPRPATPADVPALARIVAAHAVTGEVLPRSPESILEGLADWRVVEDGQGKLIACGSLWIYGPRLAELRSIIVDASHRGEGLGIRVVEGLVAEARRREISTVFTLTRAVPFFERCGFRITDKKRFPEKIWKDCHLCPLVHDCDETALILQLGSGASPEASAQRIPA